MNRFYTLLLLAFVALAFASCKKDCYDKELQEQYSVIDCHADCPGVTGCDGNFYCNECIAATQGISVE